VWKIKKFKTRRELVAWTATRGHRYQWHEVFINNAYGVEYRPLQIIG
jgi:hypothetical protein